MKKGIIFALLIIFIAPIFAASYKVENIGGRVYIGSSYEEVEIGQVLDDEDILNIRPNAFITLSSLDRVEKRTYKKPTSRIKVKEIWIESAIGKSGLKKMTIVKADIPAPSEKTREAVATAASRASEAKEDFTWDEN